MAKPANDVPAAAEKGELISKLATRGITGIDLASIAGLPRKDISLKVAERIHEMKGTTLPPEQRKRHDTGT